MVIIVTIVIMIIPRIIPRIIISMKSMMNMVIIIIPNHNQDKDYDGHHYYHCHHDLPQNQNQDRLKINMVIKIIPWLITKMKIRMNMVIIIIIVIIIILVIMVIMIIMMEFFGRDECSAFYFGRTSIFCLNHPYPKKEHSSIQHSLINCTLLLTETVSTVIMN